MSHSISNLSENQNVDTREEWRPVVGWEHLYEVSSHGRVRSLPRQIKSKLANSKTGFFWRKGTILRAAPDSSGHLIVVLCNDTYRRTMPVHVLVATAFLGARLDGHETHHKNEIKTDNRAENLVYLPLVHHARLHKQGERAPNAKLTELEVRQIRRLGRRSLFSYGQIGDMFGVTAGCVGSIARGETWRHLDDEH